MFNIEVHYVETDSFDSFENKEFIGISLLTIEDAILCLQYIKEHYEYTQQYHSLNVKGRPNPLSKEEFISQNENKPWYDKSVDEDDYSYESLHTLRYKDQVFNCFYAQVWTTFYSATIFYKEEEYKDSNGNYITYSTNTRNSI